MLELFKNLKPGVKITLFVCVALIIIAIIIVAGMTGNLPFLIEKIPV